MNYHFTDSSDDDLPPNNQNRYVRNVHADENGRIAVAGSAAYTRMHNNDMETEIHNIEQKAYFHVIRAFRAQSDAISWDKQDLMVELRKELRVSDEEHRELLSRVKNDAVIKRIREWGKANGPQSGELRSFQPVHESITSPTPSASRKKMKIGQTLGSSSAGPPLPALHPPMRSPPSALILGPPIAGHGTQPEDNQYPPTDHSGRMNANHGSTFGVTDPLIGRKVWLRWPDDRNFYKAVIKDFKQGRHALVYDVDTATETQEWVDLKDMSPQDIRWEGEDPGIFQRGGRPGRGHGSKKPSIRGGGVCGAGRGHNTFKDLTKKDPFLSQNGVAEKGLADVELLHTDTLIKEVEKVLGGSQPDTVEVEKAKKALKEHEQALIEAIARLEVPSDDESDEGGHPFLTRYPAHWHIGWEAPARIDGMAMQGR